MLAHTVEQADHGVHALEPILIRVVRGQNRREIRGTPVARAVRAREHLRPAVEQRLVNTRPTTKREMLCGSASSGAYSPPVVQPAEALGECRGGCGGCLLVVQWASSRLGLRLADHQPTELTTGSCKTGRQIVARKGGQICFQVGGCQRGVLLEERRDALQRVVDDRQQQFLLVAEVFVDRLSCILGDAAIWSTPRAR